MSATVHIERIAKRYGRVDAVREVSLALGEGEAVALVGHNGAGKTTLIKLMLGLIQPTHGSVRVLGEDPATGNVRVRRHLGYLPESVSFHMALTGRETLDFYARLKRVEPGSSHALFERVGLAPSAVDRPVRTYSKGMRQRLGLAQALLGEPRILLLDEPTSGLDPALRRHFYDLIGELRAKGATVLLSSHALDELEGRTDRVVVVSGGIKIADGTLDELRRIARLPTRITVRLCEGASPGAWANAASLWRRLDARTLEAETPSEGKLGIVAAVAADTARVADVSIVEPTLDDLYAHFLNAGGAAR